MPKNLAWAMTAFSAGNWHPLTFISHMADCQLFGLAPGGHHLTNVVLHTANAVLVLVVLFAMTGALWRSALVAALFAVHPLNVESVAWIAERKNVLSTFFWLLTMGAYVWHARRPSPRRLAVVAAFFGLGLLSKPMVVTLPCALALLDYWPLRRWLPGRSPWPLVREKLPLLGLSAVASALTIAAQGGAGAMSPLAAVPLHLRVTNAFVAYVAYLGKMVWPARLSVFYPHPGASISPASVLLAVLFLLAVTAVVLRARKAPYLAVGWLWYVGTLVPVIGIVQVGSQAMADRYAYVPLLGIFVAVAWGLADLATPRGAGLPLAAAALCAVGAVGVASSRQVWYWKDSFALFERAQAVTAGNYIAYTNLGLAYNKQKRWDEAIERFHEALRIQPTSAEALGHLGLALAKKGRVDEAIKTLEAAFGINPREVHVLNNLGVALRKRDPDRAIEHLRQAVALDPEFPEAHVNLGAALLEKGRTVEAGQAFSEARVLGSYATQLRIGSVLLERGELDGAARRFEEALAGDPRNADAHNSLGVVHLRQGRLDDALREFQTTLGLEPDHADAHSNMGTALLRKDQTKEAMDELVTAIRLNPGHVDAHTTLGAALARGGKLDEAIEHFRKAMETDPSSALAQNNLGAALLQMGDLDGAIEHLTLALKSSPANADAHSNLGLALLQKGELDRAIEELRAALQASPDHKNAETYLRQALARRRRH